MNNAGTTLRYKPGFIVGGEVIHDCGKTRGIGYFLEPLVCLALFGRLVGPCHLVAPHSPSGYIEQSSMKDAMPILFFN